ncbi:subtilisin-like protein [Auriculariales sp. MPI-PUGE-AT-0066]|nr:subtilisin-like protein [Auriculariales sp. MPI-PUGE-AT-0066]
MKGFVAAAIALATFLAPVSAAVELKHESNYPKVSSSRIVVELESTSVLGARSTDAVDIHARFFEELDRRLPNKVTVRKKFDSSIFKGATLELKSYDDVKTIAALKGVKSVTPVIRYDPPKVTKGELPVFKVAPDANAFPPLVQTGADKIQAAGNKGKGIKVGIIDTGVDYTHPSLGGGFGPGFKVEGGYDFVGDDYPNSDPVPDNDPQDCAGHGTHVSGIVAADGNNPYGILGVAPEATLRMYKIFGCSGGTDTDVIVEALLRAYDEGNDVITLSLGGLDGWTVGADSVIASRIAEAGRVVTIAAGNAGEDGLWYTSSPGNGINVISVGSTNNIGLGPLFQVTTTEPGLGPFPYQWDGSLDPLPVDGALPVYATSKDSTVVDDACNPLPDSTPDLSGYVTLVRRGTCNFTIKIQNVVSKGGRIVLLYNNGGNWGPISTGGYDAAAIVDTASGLAILDAVNAGKNFTVSFPNTGAVSIPNLTNGGLISDFTSYGPTNDLYFKPAVSAPGGQILGTYPVAYGSYAILSGTSMATPHTAGIAALILKARGKTAAKGIRDLLQTTSTIIPQTLEEGSIIQTLAQAGAGQASVYNALTYTTVVSPGQLLLNDTAHWKGTQIFTIKNTGKTTRTYTLKHVPAGTANTRVAGSIQNIDGPVPLTTSAATVKLSLSKIVLLPGLSLPIIATITPPTDVDASTIPVVSGHIQIDTAGETLKVSYLGAATAVKSVQVVDNTEDFLGVASPLLLDTVGNIQEGPTDYTFVDGDTPTLIARLVFGTPRLSVDLVSADATVQTNLKRGLPWGDWFGGLIGSLFPELGSKGGTYAKVPVIGKLYEYSYIPRNNNIDDPYYGLATPSTFSNGTTVPVGSYKLLARFLKVSGNPTKEEDYETWLSPVVNVVAA